MPPTIALYLCLLFVIWLCARDARRGKVSAALWVPLTWTFIISSKPISLWLGMAGEVDASGHPQDTSIDKVAFVFLIVAGLFVLWQRRTDWRQTFKDNKWAFAFFLYLAISVLWADDSFVSFKRWVKHFGNAVMALVILSEENPDEAIRSFLARCAYLIIPTSVLMIKYYPYLSMKYDFWTHTPTFVGITTNKNMFGMALFVCGVSICWLALRALDREQASEKKLELFIYALLLMMTVWLLKKAHSATALSCTILGVGILLAMRVPSVRLHVRRLGTWLAAIALALSLVYASGLWTVALQRFAGAVGRDVSLHGRTDIWEAVLAEKTNPFIGVGFYSFWSEERNRKISETYYYTLGTAHNGYVETYLNSGFIGLALLLAMIAAGAKRIKRQVLAGSELGALRLAFLILILLYNMTESAFDRLVPVWLMLVLVLMEKPARLGQAAPRAVNHTQLQPAIQARQSATV